MVGIDSFAEVVFGAVAELGAGFGEIALGPVLRERIGVFEIVGLEVGFENAVELVYDLVEGESVTGTGVPSANTAPGRTWKV